MENKEKIDEIIKCLKENPLFNLSLASKELFHSNFIAWLIENNPYEFNRILSSIITHEKIPNILIKDGIGVVERETRNKDLTIYLEDNKKIVIENKVKSIPSLQQLKKYSTDSGTYYILLSLIKPSFNLDKISSFTLKNNKSSEGFVWYYISYESFIEKLEKISINSSKYDNYVRDYVSFVKNLIQLTIFFDVNLCNNFEPYKYYHKLREIRLHDLYQKIYFSKIHNLLDLKVKSIDELSSFRSEVDLQSQTGRLAISYSCFPSKDLYLEVNLHNDSLRLFICDKGNKSFLENVKNVQVIEDYFSFLNKYNNSNITYPKKPNKYCNTNNFLKIYFYRRIKLENKTIEEILNILVEAMYHIKNSKDSILKEYNNIIKK
ncbi:MAG: PD-(D/E)XK nuclease family protein [Candidatus Nanoarchaeia archaeon]